MSGCRKDQTDGSNLVEALARPIGDALQRERAPVSATCDVGRIEAC